MHLSGLLHFIIELEMCFYIQINVFSNKLVLKNVMQTTNKPKKFAKM